MCMPTYVNTSVHDTYRCVYMCIYDISVCVGMYIICKWTCVIYISVHI